MYLYIYYNQTHHSRNVLQLLLSGSNLVNKLLNKHYAKIYNKCKKWSSINYNKINLYLTQKNKYSSNHLEYFLKQNFKNIEVIFYYPHNRWNVEFTKLLAHTSFKKIIYIDDFHSKNLNKANFNICNQFDKILCSYAYKAKFICPILDTTKIISFPHYIPDHMLIKYKKKIFNKILLSGLCLNNKCSCQIWRKKAYSIRYLILDKFKNNKLLKNLCIHENYKGINYYKYINLHSIAISTPGNIGYILAKYFEIPGSNSLLFAYNKNLEKDLENLGFKDGINYIGFTMENLNKKIKNLENGLIDIQKITTNGFNLIKEKHTLSKRIKKLDEICENVCKSAMVAIDVDHKVID